MHVVLQSIAGGSYLVIGLLCLVFGANRGHHIKRINSHVIFFFIYLMALWYIMNVSAELSLKSWLRDDGAHDIGLLRFISGTTIITTFTILVTYRMKEDSLDLFLHFAVSMFLNLFLFMSVIAFDSSSRMSWLAASIIFSVILIVHLIRESMCEEVVNPRFVRAIMIFITTYIGIYIASTVWGPLHEGLIGSSAQEIIMITMDLLVSLLCSIPIVHYGWALVHRGEVHLIPGTIAREFNQVRHSSTETHKLGEHLHTFT